MAIYLAPTGSGIGDVVVCRPAYDWLMFNSQEPVYLVVRGPRQVGMSALIVGLAGEVKELDLDKVLKTGDRYINLRDHPLQRDHDWFSPEFRIQFPNLRISDMLTIICREFGIGGDFSEVKPFEYIMNQGTAGKVVLVPSSIRKSKMLKTSVWLALHTALKHHGIESVVLGLPERCDDARALRDSGMPVIDTTDIKQAVDLISSSTAVISVDTGLMHIAVQQGVKTIAIYGECELYFRARSNCIPIFTADKLTRVPTEAGCLTQSFAASYDNWDWYPSEWNQGDYLAFDDIDRLMQLVLTGEPCIYSGTTR